MQTIEIETSAVTPPEISLVVVFKTFPNEDVEALIDSTKQISEKYEIILVTRKIGAPNAAQKLQTMISNKPNLVKAKLVSMEKEPDKGPSFDRNIGAALADAQILLFADDDAVVFDDVAPLLDRLYKGGFSGVQPLILNVKDREIIDSAGDFITKRENIYYAYGRDAGTRHNKNSYHAEEVPSLKSAFMLMRKDAFLAIGGFDPALSFNYEDVDLGWRMTSTEHKLLFDPTVRALHKGGRTTLYKGKQNENIVKLGTVNVHAIHLKIFPYRYWPYLIAHFQIEILKHEIAQLVKRNVNASAALSDYLSICKKFVEQINHARNQKRTLSRQITSQGMQKLASFAAGKHFFVNERELNV